MLFNFDITLVSFESYQNPDAQDTLSGQITSDLGYWNLGNVHVFEIPQVIPVWSYSLESYFMISKINLRWFAGIKERQKSVILTLMLRIQEILTRKIEIPIILCCFVLRIYMVKENKIHFVF